MIKIQQSTLFTLLLLIMGLFHNCYAQAPRLTFKHLTNEQGLSNTTVESIFQDKRGFMWFGTRDGLNRYDGNQIIVYRNNPKDTNSISDNFIHYIYEDSNQQMWVATTNGLNRFDAAKNNFTQFKHDPANNNSLANNEVSCILEDKKGNLWISTLGGGLDLYHPKENKFIHFKHPANKIDVRGSDDINFIYQDTRGNFWVATNKGLELFDVEKGNFEQIQSVNNTDKSMPSFNLIKEDKKSNLWLGTENDGLFLFNPKANTFIHYEHQEKNVKSLSGNQVRSILIDKNQQLWIGGVNGGLDLFDDKSSSFYHYQNEADNIYSLSQRTVSALFEDNQGNMWAGTHRGGINLYMPSTQKFNLYREDAQANSLSYNDVKTFYEDAEGNLWIGTDGGGLNLFDRKKNTYKHFKYDPFKNNTIASNEVLHIMEDTQANLWIATWGGGLNLFNKKTGNFTRFLNDPANPWSISSNYVQRVFEDSEKNLWVATYYGGLNLFDRKTKRFTRFTDAPDKQSHLQGDNIISIIEDKKHNIWIATDDGGLNCFDAVTKKFKHYFNKEEKNPDIRILFIDSKNRLWVGQKGLYLFDATQQLFSVYTDKAGLATEFIKGIEEDAAGIFWIATSNGLTKFNTTDYSFEKYNTADGLQGLEFETNANLKTKDGELFFGGLNGFNSFYPKNIRINTFVPPVYITNFELANQLVIPQQQNTPLKNDISFTDKIVLTYKQATFSFGFAGLNYTASENNKFASKLDGWDKGWNIGKENKASYINVKPGTYTFRVKAANNDGIWNQQERIITIIITPPFWNTWWFTFLIFLIIIAGIYRFYLFRQKLQQTKMEHLKREEMRQVQLQFFTNISHEFRTPLSLILGPIEKLQKENDQPAAASYYKVIQNNATRLLNLINELMDFRKSESGSLLLNVMPGNLTVFLQEISEEFSELARQKNILFSIKSIELKDTWFDRQVLEKVILNLLSNAFKYTKDNGEITLEVLQTLNNFAPSFKNELIIRNDFKGKEYVYLKVSDNGIGISKETITHLFERYYKISESHLGSGIGLAFVKSLTLLHKGYINVYSERDKGTEMIIAIPINKDDYNKKEKWLKNKEGINTSLESIQINYDHYLPALTEPVIKDTSKITQNKPHILLVDDNDELRFFLKESLNNEYTIIEAIDGESGFKKAKEQKPDLIISDVMMPGINGVEFCKLIKADPETNHIPFFILSAKDAFEARLDGISAGADFYFSKPLSIELLQLTIRNILLQKQKLKEHYLHDQHVEVKDLVHSAKDNEFIETLIASVEAHLINPEMDVDYICVQMGMSRTKLYTSLKSITGQSINDFIRSIRLKKAVQLMTAEDIPIIEVMYSVGIQTQSYFTKAFKKEFGKTPSQFLKELNK